MYLTLLASTSRDNVNSSVESLCDEMNKEKIIYVYIDNLYS